MTEVLSVHDALARLLELAGREVCIKGLLHFEPEDVAIYHAPRAEQRPGQASSIWLSTGTGSLGFDARVCQALRGRRVIAQGTLWAATPTQGCGHFGLWPAELQAHRLERAP